MDENNRLPLIKYWCYKILPLVYDDSLSYYEVLCKIKAAVNQLILNNDHLEEYVSAAIQAYIDSGELETLVETLFNQFIAGEGFTAQINTIIENYNNTPGFAALINGFITTYSAGDDFKNKVDALIADYNATEAFKAAARDAVKATNATAGNLATLLASGLFTDSGLTIHEYTNWTPTPHWTTETTAPTFSNPRGYAIQIGKTVFFQCSFGVANKGVGTGTFNISLPTGTNGYYGVACFYNVGQAKELICGVGSNIYSVDTLNPFLLNIDYLGIGMYKIR